jgi:hypothetical protein
MIIRCEGRIHGEITDEGVIEVKCRSERCGARAGVVVLHRFDQETGELIETKRFSDPAQLKVGKKVEGNGNHVRSVALRNP